MLKAILFDLWNTLAVSSRDWKQAYDEAGYHKNKEHDAIFEEKINTRAYTDEAELASVMCEYFGGLDKKKVEKLLIKSTAKYFDDVLPNIQKLKKNGLLIGIVSNTHNLEVKKLEFGFADAVILSSEVGMVKPDKRIFLLACKELGVKPEECIFVGDSPAMDIEGAKSAGIKAILIDRRGFHPEMNHIKDLNELMKVIQND